MTNAASSLDGTVELLMEQISALVRTRQNLRATNADLFVLEDNRRQIGRLQHELSYALIQKYRTVAA